MGRHLQACAANGSDALSQLKQRHAGLRAFFSAFPDTFDIEFVGAGEHATEFIVTLLEAVDTQEEEALIDAKIGPGCSSPDAENQTATAVSSSSSNDGSRSASSSARSASTERYESSGGGVGLKPAPTVAELRAALRVRGLSAQGNKAELVERLRGAPPPIASVVVKDGDAPKMGVQRAAGNGDEGVGSVDAGGEDGGSVLQTTVVDYLLDCGGSASSRNVGRHLAARGLLAPLKRRSVLPSECFSLSGAVLDAMDARA